VLHRRDAGAIGFVAQGLIIITGPWSRIVLMVAFVEGIVGFGAVAVWASHLHRSLSLPLSAAGAIVALYGLGGMLYMALAARLIRRLSERQMATLGACMAGLSAMVLGAAPFWQLTLPASVLGGFGLFMFHNTLQANATQMAPAARATAVSLFALSLFMGQSVGVLLASSLIERIDSGVVVALAGAGLGAVGLFFAYALAWRRTDPATR
jgi:MFS transporter, YNFM family, putative membrane transport protein